MYEAYCRIYDRSGLPYVIVEAESGPIGGDSSHEFMVPCATGEDTVLYCGSCGYAANQERAEVGQPPDRAAKRPHPPPPYKSVPTPSKRTIKEVCEFLGAQENRPRPSCSSISGTASPSPHSCAVTTSSTRPSSAGSVGASVLAPADAATIEKADRGAHGLPGTSRRQDSARHRYGRLGDADGRRRRKRTSTCT